MEEAQRKGWLCHDCTSDNLCWSSSFGKVEATKLVKWNWQQSWGSQGPGNLGIEFTKYQGKRSYWFSSSVYNPKGLGSFLSHQDQHKACITWSSNGSKQHGLRTEESEAGERFVRTEDSFVGIQGWNRCCHTLILDLKKYLFKLLFVSNHFKFTVSILQLLLCHKRTFYCYYFQSSYIQDHPKCFLALQVVKKGL